MNLERMINDYKKYELDIPSIIDPVKYGKKSGIKSVIVAPIDDCAKLAELRFLAESQTPDYKEIVEKHIPGKYLLVLTDSSNSKAGEIMYDAVAKQALSAHGHAEDEYEQLPLYIHELYLNAVIHGNHAGKKWDYTKRGIQPPSRKELAKNRKKPVCLELVITDDYVLGRVTDVGKGIGEEAKQRLKENKLEFGQTSGYALYIIQGQTGNPLVFQNKHSFSASFLKNRKELQTPNR